MIKTDFLVIGSGIAGLTFAIKTARKFPDSKVLIITKSSENNSNTRHAQGGIAAVLNNIDDSFEKHIQDTLTCGDGLCNEKVVDYVVRKGPSLIRELIDWNIEFDVTPNGSYHLGREGGHTANRVLHFADSTGSHILNTLLRITNSLPNVELKMHYQAIDLITYKNSGLIRCLGAEVIDNEGKLQEILANDTLLATGGIGQLYSTTTNPDIATGDGIAIAARAGAKTSGMEFVQFHPTALYEEHTRPNFLISEALRGCGATLLTISGYRFMRDYHDLAELAPRDIVSRAIFHEMAKNNDNFVFLDCRNVENFMHRFPTIYGRCKSTGLDPRKQLIPVVPAAHYICGGIEVDIQGKTSIENLYACGETSNTGLHGANRLASNSLLEALVFADVICNTVTGRNHVSIPKSRKSTNRNYVHFSVPPRIDNLLNHHRGILQEMMSKYAGIIRSTEGLLYAKTRLDKMSDTIERLYITSPYLSSLCELRNMITTAKLLIEQSIARKENCGGFYNKDLPKTEVVKKEEVNV